MEKEFSELLSEASQEFQPGSWLQRMVGSQLGEDSGAEVCEFLNLLYFRTSTAIESLGLAKSLFEETIKASREVLTAVPTSLSISMQNIRTLLPKLSDAFGALPSSMAAVVETMQ